MQGMLLGAPRAPRGHFERQLFGKAISWRKKEQKQKRGGATEHPVSQFETWFVLLNQVIPVFGSAVGWGQIDASGLKNKNKKRGARQSTQFNNLKLGCVYRTHFIRVFGERALGGALRCIWFTSNARRKKEQEQKRGGRDRAPSFTI